PWAAAKARAPCRATSRSDGAACWAKAGSDRPMLRTIPTHHGRVSNLCDVIGIPPVSRARLPRVRARRDVQPDLIHPRAATAPGRGDGPAHDNRKRTKRLWSSTASKAYGSASCHGTDGVWSLSASALGGQCSLSSLRVLHCEVRWTGMPSNLFVTL